MRFTDSSRCDHCHAPLGDDGQWDGTYASGTNDIDEPDADDLDQGGGGDGNGEGDDEAAMMAAMTPHEQRLHRRAKQLMREDQKQTEPGGRVRAALSYPDALRTAGTEREQRAQRAAEQVRSGNAPSVGMRERAALIDRRTRAIQMTDNCDFSEATKRALREMPNIARGYEKGR